jgi:hypothetical protein
MGETLVMDGIYRMVYFDTFWCSCSEHHSSAEHGYVVDFYFYHTVNILVQDSSLARASRIYTEK